MIMGKIRSLEIKRSAILNKKGVNVTSMPPQLGVMHAACVRMDTLLVWACLQIYRADGRKRPVFGEKLSQFPHVHHHIIFVVKKIWEIQARRSRDRRNLGRGFNILGEYNQFSGSGYNRNGAAIVSHKPLHTALTLTETRSYYHSYALNVQYYQLSIKTITQCIDTQSSILCNIFI